ncbi:hypothetical protein [Peribacillus saganii]|nr:hypothetical protein [Peribacillus saganii]
MKIAIGYSDCIHSRREYSHKNVEKILMGRGVINILHFEVITDLVVEFESSYLELFHDSSNFEGRQLLGDNGFYLFSISGGSC